MPVSANNSRHFYILEKSLKCKGSQIHLNKTFKNCDNDWIICFISSLQSITSMLPGMINDHFTTSFLFFNSLIIILCYLVYKHLVANNYSLIWLNNNCSIFWIEFKNLLHNIGLISRKTCKDLQAVVTRWTIDILLIVEGVWSARQRPVTSCQRNGIITFYFFRFVFSFSFLFSISLYHERIQWRWLYTFAAQRRRRG